MLRVAKCTEVIFEKGKMVKYEDLEVRNGKMKAIHPDENEMYQFLGVEQAVGSKKKEVYNRVKEKIVEQ